eukprot:g21709.t1
MGCGKECGRIVRDSDYIRYQGEILSGEVEEDIEFVPTGLGMQVQSDNAQPGVLQRFKDGCQSEGFWDILTVGRKSAILTQSGPTWDSRPTAMWLTLNHPLKWP